MTEPGMSHYEAVERALRPDYDEARRLFVEQAAADPEVRAAILAPILALHYIDPSPDYAGNYCHADVEDWPCPTALAAGVVPDRGGVVVSPGASGEERSNGPHPELPTMTHAQYDRLRAAILAQARGDVVFALDNQVQWLLDSDASGERVNATQTARVIVDETFRALGVVPDNPKEKQR